MDTGTQKSQLIKKRSHNWIDARSLALAKAVAEKIRRDPSLLRRATENLARWKGRRTSWPKCLREWEKILSDLPVSDLLALLVEDSEEGRRRRQSSPFTGILTAAERKAIFEQYDAIGT